MVRIKCADTQKHTKTMKSTNSPFWDEVFFFNFNAAPADLFDQLIEFQVYNSTGYLRDALIGSFKIDIGFIYDQQFHSLITKWLLLSDAEDSMSGAKGYLKVTINVLGPGDEVPVSLIFFNIIGNGNGHFQNFFEIFRGLPVPLKILEGLKFRFPFFFLRFFSRFL